MREITLRIPETKFAFFMELVSQLGLEMSEKQAIPQVQMDMVRDRIQKSKEDPDRLLDWNEVEDSFMFD